MLEYSLLLVFPAAMAFAASMDLVSMTIPNRVSLAILGGFLVAAPATGMVSETILAHLGIGVGVLVFGFALFALGYVGGGDAKLLAAASLWIGPQDLLAFIYMTTLLGGALSLAMLYYRQNPVPEFMHGQSWALRLHEKGEGVPYGLALAGAALLVFPSTEWFRAVALG